MVNKFCNSVFERCFSNANVKSRRAFCGLSSSEATKPISSSLTSTFLPTEPVATRELLTTTTPFLTALTAASTVPSTFLSDEGRTTTTGRGARRLRRSLVVAQVAFAFVLLIGAGLLFASFRKVLAIDLSLPSLDVDYALHRDLRRLDPCGIGNPEPLLVVEGLTVTRVRPASGGHTQLTLRRRLDVLDGIAFGRSDLAELVAYHEGHGSLATMTVVRPELQFGVDRREGRRCADEFEW